MYKYSLMLFLAILSTSCSVLGFRDSVKTSAEETAKIVSGAPPAQEKLSTDNLSATLMSYFDTYMGRMNEAADDVINENSTADQRLVAHEAKVYPCYALLSLATDPDPKRALLDMMVVVSLERRNFGQGWAIDVFGDDYVILHNAQIEMEERMWKIGRQVYTEKEMNQIEDLILEWNELNQDRRYVSSVRFYDFTSLTSFTPSVFGVDVLASLNRVNPINQFSGAVSSIDKATNFADRARFIAQRIPILIGWQAEMHLYKMVLQPEAKTLLRQTETITRQIEELNNFVATVPNLVSSEREATLEQVSALVEEERKAILAAVENEVSGIKDISENTRASVESLERTIPKTADLVDQGVVLLGEASTTVKTVESLLDTISSMSEKSEDDPTSAREPGRRFDITDYTKALEQAEATLKEVRGTVGDLESTLKDIDQNKIVETVDQKSTELLNQTFIRGLLLILIFWAGAMIYLFFSIRYRKRPVS